MTLVVSVDMGGTKIYGALVDDAGTILHEYQVRTGSNGLPSLTAVIDHLLQYGTERSVSGIGVGVPGIVKGDGIVTDAPALGWTDFELKQVLQAQFGLPTAVENDVNLAALGEYRFGTAAGAESLICIAVGTGIGSGIVLNGRLYRGHTAGAGEIGYMIPGTAFLGRDYVNRFGALESVASGTGITARAYQLGHDVTSEAVIAAHQNGETWATDIIDETIDYLTLAVANIAAILDPEVVVFSGGVMAAPDVFIPAITARLHGLVPAVPRVVASTLGARATVLGAAARVLTEVSEQQG